MANKPIPVSTADTMVQEYLNYIKSSAEMSTQTQSVSFAGKELMEWLNQTMPNADEIRVCFGIYPEGHAQAGRITVILWPYKDGQPAKTNPPIPPFNDGQGRP